MGQNHSASVAEVVAYLLNDGDGATEMNERRYHRARELLDSGERMETVEAAVNRINAAVWLLKHPNNITDEEVYDLLQTRPWEEMI